MGEGGLLVGAKEGTESQSVRASRFIKANAYIIEQSKCVRQILKEGVFYDQFRLHQISLGVSG